MPANEQIWRSIKRMHLVFGVAAVIMLIATIWMFTEDHAREYKDWQKSVRRIDQWTVRAQLAENQSYPDRAELIRARARRALALVEPIDGERIGEFQRRVVAWSDSQETTAPDDALGEIEALYGDFQERIDDPAVQKAAESVRHALESLDSEATYTASQQDYSQLNDATAAVDALEDASRSAVRARQELLDSLDDFVKDAQLSEDNASREEKFQKANLTEAVSQYDLAIHQGEPVDAIEARIEVLKEQVARLSRDVAVVEVYRQDLERIVRQIDEDRAEAVKRLEQAQSDTARLRENVKGWWETIGDFVIRQPILDAFYTSPEIGIEQVWLPDLTINYNFSDVARFDRCATCHRNIDRTAPGSAVQPAYHHQRQLTVTLPTPDAEPDWLQSMAANGGLDAARLADEYGFRLADEGREDPTDVTVQFVWPETLAARAGLEMGDVIRQIGDAPIYEPRHVAQYLLGPNVAWGEPLTLHIERGLPHPFVSHPRLELFVGSLSPHTKEEMGCTICHDGQGSSTSFKWASHTPNSPREADQWHEAYGWFDNPHWIFPMYPTRFVESGCLKCHHEVTELMPSDRFPEPPAPKLVRGYELVKTYGCYGCHEISGYDGPEKRVGPDLRLEPPYHEAARGILVAAADQLTDEEQQWATALASQPYLDGPRRRLHEAIEEDLRRARAENPDQPPRLNARTHSLGALLVDAEIPGQLTKAGPSLRHVNSKLDHAFLYSWIRRPADFRPTTRMPQFFGQWEHLHGEERDEAQRFEPVEIRAMVQYLQNASQSFTPLAPPDSVTEQASAERGKKLFQVRGCLACHAHQDFPGIASRQGPDLSRLGAKLNTDRGRAWLYSWLKQPSHYSVRTQMPDMKLDPVDLGDGNVSDPAADIAAYLLTASDWQPEDIPPADPAEMGEAELAALHDLALEYLAGTFPRTRAEQYVEQGIPGEMASSLTGAEHVLVGMTPDNRVQRQLAYVGQRAISKYGCFGCHDIPGFETAKPIGTALADWGRKDPSKLAFEQIEQFLATHGVDGKGAHDAEHAGDAGDGEPGHGLAPTDFDPDTGYYVQAINSHSRHGFIWQKLRMPRTYDYKKTEHKGYNERLRMPRFTFDALDAEANAADREAVITFVLGLVAEPPADPYIYDPDPRGRAIVEGRKVLDKFNCAGCHTLEMPRWRFSYDEYAFPEPAPSGDYPFIEPHFTPDDVSEGVRRDRQGRLRADVRGRPLYSEATGRPMLVDEDGVPLAEGEEEEYDAFYPFVLWEPALLNGKVRPAGQTIPVPADGITKFPAQGGALAEYLFPVVIADEKKNNPQVKPAEAWGWLPPPLVGEGEKVQPDWLYQFLMDPHPIRPAAVLRMPRFTLTPSETRALVDYFAAVDGAPYPFEFEERTQQSYLVKVEKERPRHMDDALAIILNRNYCIQCHSVADFVPAGRPVALAPNLGEVYRRLRPEWLRNWIANPKRLLPYTGMPVNIPYDKGIPQEMYAGESTQQLDALVDFLMNFDRYAEKQISIQAMVPEPSAETESQAGN